MKKAIVASLNPVKLDAVRAGLRTMFPQEEFEVEGVTVESGVANQPLSDDETLTGARNRAAAALRARPEADLWFGIEGGIEDGPNGMAAFAWVEARSRERSSPGRTGTFFLPSRIAALVRRGLELGEADDRVFGQENSKQANGAVGLLTGNAIDRTTLYATGVVLALIPFRNEELFEETHG